MVDNKLNSGRPIAIAAFAIWLFVALAGLVWANRYTGTAANLNPAPPHWPVDSSLSRSTARPTLIMFAHPRCPCTSASLDELDRLLCLRPKQLDVHVLFLSPAELGESWPKIRLWRKAAAIPGVTVGLDVDGLQSKLFNSQTSGETLLYSADGVLLFQGGITISRGHSGDNPGLTAIVQILNDGGANNLKSAVFGCPLRDQKCAAVTSAL